mgnify:CR=1 FL=1
MGKSYNRKVISIYTEFTAFMRRIKIFISSVQSEFSKERAMLCHYIRTDVLLGKFFEPFIFEEVPANEYPISHVYLNEVKLCDIYLGLYGNLYGHEDAEGVSPTEREYDLAAELHKSRLIYIKSINEDDRIANAAILLFGKKPQKYFIPSEVKCVQFYGNVVRKPMPAYQIYRGDVFELVDQSTSFVMSRVNNWVGTRDEGETASVPTHPELPIDAVKEAIVNAICHRDYTSNASVQVMLFRNRLEIWNPGQLPYGLTVQKLQGPHKSLPTNPLIADPMYWKGYIEKVGTGTEDIIEKCRDYGLKTPEFYQEEDFRVVIWRTEEQSDPKRSKDDPKMIQSDPKEVEDLIGLIKNNPSISRAELARRLDLSERQVRKIMGQLRADERLTRKGGKIGEWIITDK